MDVKDLRLVVALAEHRHFARAAAASNISQPAFSARIRKLEEELGAPIVERGQRFEGFTAEGDRVLSWARRILADCDGLLQRESLSGELTVGVVPSALPLCGWLTGAFAAAHPEVSVTILSRSSIAIQAGLDDYSLEAGITYLTNEPVRGVRSVPLYTERYCLIAPEEIVPKKIKDTISWADAASLPLCLLTPNMQNRRIIDAAFAEVEHAPQPHVEANSFTGILTHVRTGHFATVLPEAQALNYNLDGLVKLPLTKPELTQSVGLVIPDRDPVLPITKRLLELAETLTLPA
jgi:DNA-binding transcriptional LysR family regulator